MLDKETIAKLDKPLDPSRVKHRQGGGGMSLAYLKGHNVIDQANDIFGFGGWGYDILMVELVNILDENGQIIGGYYAARVRLTVRDCVPITEEGVCPIQDGRNPRAKIDAHDMARKGAVTDAMKRALRCYGDQFGNSLYDTDLIDGQPGTEKKQAQPGQGQQHQQPPTQATRPQATQNAPAPTTRPAPAQTAPKAVTAPAPKAVANPKEDSNYKHYSKEFAGARTVKDLEETVEVMKIEVQDEGVLALLRSEYKAAKDRLHKASVAAADEFTLSFE